MTALVVVLAVAVVVFAQLGNAAFGEGDPGVHFAVEVRVSDLVQGVTLVRIGAHDVLHAVEVGVDFTAQQHAVTVFTLSDDAVIECLPTCRSADDPPRYPPVTAGEHLMAKLLGPRTGTASTAADTAGDRLDVI